MTSSRGYSRMALMAMIGLAGATSPRLIARPISPDEILKRADAARGPDGQFSFLVKVRDQDGDSMLRENLYRVYCKGARLAMIETLAPQRLQGRKILMRDNDLWLYLPSVHRPTRISMQQRLTGQVANGDIARTGFHDDYTARLVGNSTQDGRPVVELLLRARNHETTYRKIRLWVDAKNYRPIRADFFALSGKLLKQSEYGEFEPVFGAPRATRVVIRDALHPTKQSLLKYYQYRREELDDSFFNKDSMP